MARWGFIGCGNLAQSLISGSVKLGTLAPTDVIAVDHDAKKLAVFSKSTRIHTAGDVLHLVVKADIIVLAVKPQDITPLLEELGGEAYKALAKKKAVVSLAAGVSEKILLKHLKNWSHVTRVMANTPALVQSGAFGILTCKKSPKSGFEN